MIIRAGWRTGRLARWRAARRISSHRRSACISLKTNINKELLIYIHILSTHIHKKKRIKIKILTDFFAWDHSVLLLTISRSQDHRRLQQLHTNQRNIPMPKIKRKNKWREVEAEGTLNENKKIKKIMFWFGRKKKWGSVKVNRRECVFFFLD